LDDDFDGAIDNPEEIDSYDGIELEELVKLADASYRSETEESFLRYTQSGDGWNARSKNGILHQFGLLSAAQIEHGTRRFAWLLEKSSDLNGNIIEFSYMSHPDSPGQKYVKEIRWARNETAAGTRPSTLETTDPIGAAFYAAVFNYESNRPDQYSDYRSGFEVRTGLRLSRIDVIMQGVPSSPGALTGDFNGDAEPDTLIRRYLLEYQAGALQSLLSRITQRGSDGVTALPTLSFDKFLSYTPSWQETGTFLGVLAYGVLVYSFSFRYFNAAHAAIEQALAEPNQH
jgi:hypothetical protein